MELFNENSVMHWPILYKIESRQTYPYND